MNNSVHKGLSYARRMYLPRTVGLGIGFFSVAAAIYPSHPPAWVWALMLFHGYGWPHVAYQLARFSSQPYQAERRTLIYDSLAGGFWAGVMGFNPLPTVTVLSMMAMNNIAAGGPRIFVLGCVAQLAGSAVGYAVFTPVLFPDVTQIQIYACLPMLVIYPLAIGLVCYRVAVQLSRSKKALEKLSTTDSLTGLMNHGAWKDLLTVEFNNCQALNRQNSVALIDIDHFKSINDRHGHAIGDRAIVACANAMRNTLRDADVLGRMGGEEFAALLPLANERATLDTAERLRMAVEAVSMDLAPGETLRFTVSIGATQLAGRLTSVEGLLIEADESLYRAKSEGRNRVATYLPPPFQTYPPIALP